MELNAVATYYGVSPREVRRWSMPEFLDNQEYMYLRNELKRQRQANLNG